MIKRTPPMETPVAITSTHQQPSTSHSHNSANIKNAPSTDITNVYMDLTLSESENEDETLTNGITKVENDLLCTRMSRETNTQIGCLQMVDKSTNSEPLIILSSDEVVAFQDGLTIASFKESLISSLRHSTVTSCTVNPDCLDQLHPPPKLAY